METTKLTGGCLCGAVRFAATGAPYRVGLCHCMTCRKMSGSVFNAFAVYPAAAVELTGRTGAFATSAQGRQHFCPTCGASVFWREEDADEIELHLGSFDEPDRLRPSYELWVVRRESWLPEIPGLARHAGNRKGTGRSEP